MFIIWRIAYKSVRFGSHDRIRIYEYAAAVMYPFILREPADVSM